MDTLLLKRIRNGDSTLTAVDVSGRSDAVVTGKALRSFCEALRQTENAQLRSLNLSGHKVGERGAHWLADALRAKTIGIGQLVLSVRLSILLSGVMRCDIGTEGAGDILRSLQTNTTLRELDLSGNRIDSLDNAVDGQGCSYRGISVLNLSRNSLTHLPRNFIAAIPGKCFVDVTQNELANVAEELETPAEAFRSIDPHECNEELVDSITARGGVVVSTDGKVFWKPSRVMRTQGDEGEEVATEEGSTGARKKKKRAKKRAGLKERVKLVAEGDGEESEESSDKGSDRESDTSGSGDGDIKHESGARTSFPNRTGQVRKRGPAKLRLAKGVRGRGRGGRHKGVGIRGAVADTRDLGEEVLGSYEVPQIDDVQVCDHIGYGYSADVHRARWRNMIVAMKVPRLDSDDVVRRWEEEVKIMLLKVGRHDNIVRSFGMCRRAIVMEYSTLGDLYSWVLKRYEEALMKQGSGGVSADLLVSLLLQVARGMQHLHRCSVFHGDLAARNVLLFGDTNNIRAKVSDFGLARVMRAHGAHTVSVHKTREVPTYECAPEVLSHRIYSFQGDVWSFGVLCWQLFSGGKIMYDDLEPRNPGTVRQFLEQGGRLHRPGDQFCAMPDRVWELVCQCWQSDPPSRPSFDDIVTVLRDISP